MSTSRLRARARAPDRSRRSRGMGFGLAVLLAAAGTAMPAPALEWDIQQVEPAMMFVTSSLALDLGPDGTPHIVHSMDHYVRYLVYRDGAWPVEVVNPGDIAGAGISMALDPGGEPWLIYGEGGFEDTWPLRVAYRKSGVWTITALPDELNFLPNCAIGFGTDGVPQIAYGNAGGLLQHGYWAGSTWHIQPACTSPGSGFDVSFALDSQDHPYMCRWQTGPYQACTWWDGAAWQQRILDDQVDSCNCIHSGIAIDRFDNPHMVWETHYCEAPVSLRYAQYTSAGGWTFETIHRDLSVSSAGCSIVTDRTGAPHVVYGTFYMTSGGTSNLRYAHRRGSMWVTELIDAAGDVGEINSLKIDQDGYLHVAYFAGDGVGQNGEIRYARSRQAVGMRPGDLNCDGDVNAFDIDPFVLALTDAASYAAEFPYCAHRLADCNGDGAVDAFDIDPFVLLLTGG